MQKHAFKFKLNSLMTVYILFQGFVLVFVKVFFSLSGLKTFESDAQ